MFVRIRLQFLECFTPPRCLISQGCALPASPVGKLLYRALGCGGCRGRYRPFGCGTAHRPFPTVSLTGGCFQPGNSKNVPFSGPFGQTRVRSQHALPERFKGTTEVCPITVNCQLSTVNSPQNCQLSIVHCQLIIPFAQKARRKRNGGPFLNFWGFNAQNGHIPWE